MNWQADLFLEGMEIECILGDLPHERINPQIISLDIQARLDLTQAQLSEDLEQTVDYVKIANLARNLAVLGQYRLVESLAKDIASQALSHWISIIEIQVQVTKFQCIPDVKKAGIKVRLSR